MKEYEHELHDFIRVTSEEAYSDYACYCLECGEEVGACQCESEPYEKQEKVHADLSDDFDDAVPF